ncbi:MAG: sugar isomerase domain-containing protein [Armatimonadota bacterium]
MLGRRYVDAIRSLLGKISTEQMSNIERAGELVADCWASGGAVFITEMGHGTASELTNRAGGLIALRQFSFSVNVNSTIASCQQDRPRATSVIPQIEQVRTAVKLSQIRPGDVVFVGSVSGKNIYPIETALQCQELGAKVIVLTALEYTERVSSAHPSGKKLKDVGDLVIDICAPIGDAALAVEGLPVKVLPVSGIAFITIMWMICGEAIEQMLKRGLRPHVYMSHNIDGGPEFNQREIAEYNQVGY